MPIDTSIDRKEETNADASCSKQNKTMHGQSPTTSARLMRFVRMYDAQPKMVPGAHDQIALNRTEPN